MKHGWTCKCFDCRVWRARHYKDWRNGKRLLVSARRARQILLTFEDAKDAARALNMPMMTVWRIRKGEVKKIRKSTETKILLAA
jgi:hypothetical protein